MRESEYQHSEPLVSEAIATPRRFELTGAPEGKDARMSEALTRLDAGIEQLLEDPASYFRVMARFHKFSLSNQIMIYAQKPDATHVAGFKQWQEKFGRQVQKGEKSIKIFYPRFRKERDEATGEDKQKLTGFGLGSVFDVSQTEGDPLPEHPPITENVSTNDVATAVNLKLSRWCIDQGLRMESVPMDGHRLGDYHPTKKQIRIRLTPEASPFSVSKTKTLAHETAHFLADHKGSIDRRDAETVAEASAFVAMSYFGMDTELYSSTYIAGWAEDRERLHTNLAEIHRVGSGIISAVEGVGDPYADDFGSEEQMGDGPIALKLREEWDLTDRDAPNL